MNRLGDRIRRGEESDDDIALLEEVRGAYISSGDVVFSKITARVSYAPTRRAGKTTKSIREKLKRQATRLSRMQDIDGCRFTVPTLREQDELVGEIRALFPDCEVQDLRQSAHFGYRAVHVIIDGDHPFEVQIRTEVQNRWAQLSEALAGRFGVDLKYGGGPPKIREGMEALSRSLEQWDQWKAKLNELTADEIEARQMELQEDWDVIDRQISGALIQIETARTELAPLTDPDNIAGE